jgi:hypothetical protein
MDIGATEQGATAKRPGVQKFQDGKLQAKPVAGYQYL